MHLLWSTGSSLLNPITMQTNLSKEDVMNSVRVFKTRRDDLLHEDTDTFDHHLERFVEFCRQNPLVQRVLAPLQSKFSIDAEEWWNIACQREGKIAFPSDLDEELVLRYHILEQAASNENLVFRFGIAQGQRK